LLEWFEFLSGEVPGGIAVLIALLLTVYFTFHLLQHSKLISKSSARNKTCILSLALILLYFTLWNVLRPPQPRIRILTFPTMDQNNNLLEGQSAFKLPELANQIVHLSLKNKYLIHRWEWTYSTLSPDSLDQIEYWDRLAKRLDTGILIKSKMNENGTILVIALNKESGDSLVTQAANLEWDSLIKTVSRIIDEYEIVDSNSPGAGLTNYQYLDTKLKFLRGNYEQVLTETKNIDDPQAKVLYADALLQKGLKVEIDREKGQYTGFKNTHFDEIKNLIYPLIRSREDPPAAAIFWVELPSGKKNLKMRIFTLKRL